MYFLDTSALVKLYVEEPGSDRVEKLIEPSLAEGIGVLDLARVEFRSALRLRERIGDLAAEDILRALRKLDEEWDDLFLVQRCATAVLEQAIRILDRRPLRAYDATQLAGALVLSRSVGSELVFVSADSALIRAAAAEGLQTLNPLDRRDGA